jgi:hypothetical protein
VLWAGGPVTRSGSIFLDREAKRIDALTATRTYVEADSLLSFVGLSFAKGEKVAGVQLVPVFGDRGTRPDEMHGSGAATI